MIESLLDRNIGQFLALSSSKGSSASSQNDLVYLVGAIALEALENGAMFAVDRRWRTIVIHVLELAMPPNIAAFFHVDFIMRALENNYVLH